MQLRKEAWIKNSGLQRGLNPWPRDSGAMLYQLSYEATDAGSGSVVGSYVPLKEVSVNDIWNKSYMNYGNENEEMIVAVNGNLCNCVKKPEKKKKSGLQRGLNPWPRDTGAMLYQLSYEATGVGSGSIVGSYVLVKEMKSWIFFRLLYAIARSLREGSLDSVIA